MKISLILKIELNYRPKRVWFEIEETECILLWLVRDACGKHSRINFAKSLGIKMNTDEGKFVINNEFLVVIS